MSSLSKTEMERRTKLTKDATTLILNTLPIEAETDSGLMMEYKDFYLQIDFSCLHPLMVFTFVRKLKEPFKRKATPQRANDFNLQSTIGCHCFSESAGAYIYRAASWLDTELTESRFLEMLDRCFEEACWAYGQIHSPQ